ncbi:CD151 antigen-like [Ruditapes philippinarum]|uniref:CD151 antigen-like n=1 Tax=Ruditapes philippinarum TaxID=129788 RepID=UPI00295A8ED5|nr:CD151 antigen-like [Ruditapes philippinarum]
MQQHNGSQPPSSPAKNRRKNPDYCGKTFLRNVLYVFNLVFFFSGAAFLAVGLYILLSRHSFVSLLGGAMFPVTTYLIVATGVLIIVIGCVGCFGACQENRCLLFTYASFLLVIFLLEAVAGVLAYMYNGVISEELTRNLNETMMEKYNFDVKVTKAIDDMQQEFFCCGSNSFEDWKYSKWLKENKDEQHKTPDSCCKSEDQLCAIRDHPSNINYLGCSRRLEQVTKESLILIGGIALGFCFIQVFGIIFSCCLIRKIKEAKYRY